MGSSPCPHLLWWGWALGRWPDSFSGTSLPEPRDPDWTDWTIKWVRDGYLGKYYVNVVACRCREVPLNAELVIDCVLVCFFFLPVRNFISSVDVCFVSEKTWHEPRLSSLVAEAQTAVDVELFLWLRRPWSPPRPPSPPVFLLWSSIRNCREIGE